MKYKVGDKVVITGDIRGDGKKGVVSWGEDVGFTRMYTVKSGELTFYIDESFLSKAPNQDLETLLVVAESFNDIFEKLTVLKKKLKASGIDELNDLAEITEDYAISLDIELSYIDGLMDGLKKGERNENF